MEIAIVLIIALIVFGPRKLPELGSSLGRGIREFKGSLGGEERDAPRSEREPVDVAAATETSEVEIPAGQNGHEGLARPIK